MKKTGIICLLILMFSCKNKLDINAEYKEIPSIYAVLCPQENLHMIRVNKTFLSEDNANQYAQVTDSVNYPAGELEIRLTRFVNGNPAPATMNGNKPVAVFHDSVIQTLPGAFSTQQRIYVNYDKLFPNGLYVLTVKNLRTGNVFTAKANSLDSMPLGAAQPFANPLYPVPYHPNNPPYFYIDYSNPNVFYSIVESPVNGAYFQDLRIRMHYYDSLSGGNKIFKSFDFTFSYLNKNNISDGKYKFSFYGQTLYDAVGNHLKNVQNPPGFLGRRMYKIDFLVTAAPIELYDYLQFSAPSLTFSQEKILYSNFEGRKALGIFTFRSRCHISKEMANSFVTQFALNKATCAYNFYKFIPQGQGQALQLGTCP
ncbi:MAG: hypothetical protein N3F09_08130 [Bacteroidia bacterium]|nr:hypothetical protein [Bacteroidia bacterium]